MVCRVTILSPGLRYWPGLTVVMPSRPAKGARMVFFETNAACCATLARLTRTSASSASTCARLTAWASYCWRSRASTVAARSAAAWSDCNCARSDSALSSSSTSPAFTSWPERKCRLRTRPAISVVTSTPRTALSVPTALNCGCHSASSAFTADTTCAPGLGELAISCLICRNLPNASTAINTKTHPNMMSMRLVVRVMVPPKVSGIRGVQVDAIPPAAAQCLEQCCRVGVARGLRLHQRDAGLVVGALRVQQRQVAHRAELVLATHQSERLARERFGFGLGTQRLGIAVERAQGIGHIQERVQHRLLVLGMGFVVGGDGGALLRPQRPAVEQGLQQGGADAPARAGGAEQRAQLQALRAHATVQ